MLSPLSRALTALARFLKSTLLLEKFGITIFEGFIEKMVMEELNGTDPTCSGHFMQIYAETLHIFARMVWLNTFQRLPSFKS